MSHNTERRQAMLEARRNEQRSRQPGIVKRNGLDNPRQRPLTIPIYKTGKQYNYTGRR